jgi:hypothetical protein
MIFSLYKKIKDSANDSYMFTLDHIQARDPVHGQGSGGICPFHPDLVIDQAVLSNKDYVDLIIGDVYYHKTYDMGLVGENNKVNFYNGTLRVIKKIYSRRAGTGTRPGSGGHHTEGQKHPYGKTRGRDRDHRGTQGHPHPSLLVG